MKWHPHVWDDLIGIYDVTKKIAVGVTKIATYS